MNCKEFNEAMEFVSKLEDLLVSSEKISTTELVKNKYDCLTKHNYLKNDTDHDNYLNEWCSYVSDLIQKYELELK